MRYFWSDLSGLLAVVYRAGEIHRLIDQQGARGLPLVDVIRRPSLTAAVVLIPSSFRDLRCCDVINWPSFWHVSPVSTLVLHCNIFLSFYMCSASELCPTNEWVTVSPHVDFIMLLERHSLQRMRSPKPKNLKFKKSVLSSGSESKTQTWSGRKMSIVTRSYTGVRQHMFVSMPFQKIMNIHTLFWGMQFII